MARAAGPDFICIGQPKAGTSWLYEQLAQHPDFWLPPVKEFNYLSRDVPRLRSSVGKLRRMHEAAEEPDPGRAARRQKREQRRTAKRGDRSRMAERDRAFLEASAPLNGKPMDLDAYVRMFQMKGDMLTGDMSPSYMLMEGERIARIAQALPDAKVVLLVREPISRTWSRLGQKWRNGDLTEEVLTDPAQLGAFIDEGGGPDALSHPAKLIPKWRQYAPGMPFRHFFFDDIEKDSDAALREIVAYIGGDPGKKGDMPPEYNRKANNPKPVMTDAVRRMLIERLRDEIVACADMLGGPAKAWPAKYGL